MVEIAGISASPGERTFGYVDVTALATGCRLRIPVHIVNGTEPGPVLLVTSTAHGEEIATILTVRDLVAQVSPAGLKGTLVAVPVMNLPAFETQSAFTRLDDWSLDEAFPATTTPMVAWARGWATQQLASALARLMDAADYAIDLRSGNHHLAACSVSVNATDDAVYSAKVLELGQVFGLDSLYAEPAADSTLALYASLAGVPLVTAELGGGHPYDQNVMARGLTGIFNVMKLVGMVSGKPITTSSQVRVDEHRLIRTKHGGMFYPEVGADLLGTSVVGGTVLGRVVHSQTLREIETITAPYERTRLLSVRALFSAVHPGEIAYLVGDQSAVTG